jgi:peptide/nickel transport system permease protein
MLVTEYVRFVVGRLAAFVPTLVLLSAITFFLGLLTPSDPVIVKLGQHADPAAVERLRREYGLDRPPLEQFGRFLAGAIRGDFGISYYDDSPVSRTLAERVPTTLRLGLVAICLAVAAGVPLGLIAAIRRDTWVDRATMSLSLVGLSVPGFVIGPLLIWLFAQQLGWLPVARWGRPIDYALPAITLACRPTALIARIMRASMLEVLAQDYVRTAMAKGLTRARVLMLHAFKNAVIPTLTVIGTAAGYMLGGSFVVETIFAVPGIGSRSITAIQQRDYPMIQATTLLLAAVFVTINLVVDLLYGAIDPRIRQRARDA